MPDPTRGPGRLTPILLAAASLLALAPAARATTEGASVPVRSGRHPGFERLVLAWPTAVTPQMRQEDGLVRITFPTRERLDLSAVVPPPGGPIIAVEAGQGREGTELLVRVRP